jgi:AraC family transcriptional regulator
MHETLRRRRVEQACKLLRRSTLALAEVAASTGFCDQSHMNRCFQAVLGRTPARVRMECSDRAALRSLRA